MNSPESKPPFFEKYLTRVNKTKADLLRSLGLDPKSSLINAYIKGRATPSYEMCSQLLKNGMTVEELFGDEIWDIAKQNAKFMESFVPEALSDDECRRIVEIGISAIRQGKAPD